MEKHKKIIQNNKFKISFPTWSDSFDLTDGSYSVADIQDYFEHILKKNIVKVLITYQSKYM